MTQFNLDPSNRFVISGYPEMRPFSSFLPGIAGLNGIPLWAFYVNRGQGITSFGVESKDSPIMEFQPANKAYQNTSFTGFRTFLKIYQPNEVLHYEPFSPWSGVKAINNQMIIGLNELEFEEVNETVGLRIHVRYFLVPNDTFGGLVRQLTIENIAKTRISFDVLDGMPSVIPYGVNNFLLKELGRTVEAWMEVFNLPANVPFYRLRASVIDRAEVETFRAGHFALAFGNDGKLLPAFVDPAVIFGLDSSFYQPSGFYNQSLESLCNSRQITCGRTPCGFFATQAALNPGESLKLSSIYGHTGDMDALESIALHLTQSDYVENKYQEAAALVNKLTDVVSTHTASPVFDAYCRQNFLDNVLRGGWPVQLNDVVFPIYSRKHGDPERDYNAFFVSAEPYSQGEGSYRDVNQNRRDNVLLEPVVGDTDIRTFMSLIQADGYNPRAVKGFTFQLSPDDQKRVLSYTKQPEKIQELLRKPFTPGKLLRVITENKIELFVPPHQFLLLALKNSQQNIEADFHEGYWIDHWEYNLDLIESFLMVYPEKQLDLLFEKSDVPFFDSPVVVQPRSKRYVLVNGLPRQLNSLLEDREKQNNIAQRIEQPQWARTKEGQIYRVTLFSKMALIVLLKYTTLDPWGMGIEMEASRPGWDDALNGLPALFGSGMPEAYELLRWINFLLKVIPAASPRRGFQFPQEAAELVENVLQNINIYNQSSMPDKEMEYWDAVATSREAYRERVRIRFNGAEAFIKFDEFSKALETFRGKLEAGIQRAVAQNQGLPPTYFMYNLEEYDILQETDPLGHPYIRPRRFTPVVLPLFLEGPVRAYKILKDVESAKELYRRVKDSPLYDKKLHMYKLNASLEDQPHAIGRVRAFPAGWLENESIWLHMEYKYLLETLKAGLYDQFYEEMKNVMVPFLDPNQYGRSTLENSSFLVSSAHPDESLHGAGFVARLSGSTAEFISIWNIMMAGSHPFLLQDGQLCLSLQPALPGWLFTETGEASFCFLGSCTVTYHNPEQQNTHFLHPNRILFLTPDGKMMDITEPVLGAPYAAWVRSGKITKIDIWY